MNKKENTPLVVLKSLEPYLSKQGEYFRTDNPEDDLIRFSGSSPDSEFFYHIKSTRLSNNQHQIEIEYRPYSNVDVNPKKFWVKCDSIETSFEAWTSLLEQYAKTRTPFDDPIIESYYNEYFADFEIIDEEKDKPLDSSSIILLFEHFEEIKFRLEEHKNETNSAEIEEIQVEIDELNSSITSKNRHWIATKVSLIWAKLTKMGVVYFKEFVVVSRKMIFKEGASKVFELVEKGIDLIQ